MKKGFLTNKYTLSVFILLAILAVDVILHKGMSRVMLPKSFTDKRNPSTNKPTCEATILSSSKTWAKAINSAAMANKVDSLNGGVEMDVYFDTAQNSFFVYHDSSRISNTRCEEVLTILEGKSKKFSVWLDFKNLNATNAAAALEKLKTTRQQFGLENRMIVESSNVELLNRFCENGFYSSYYIPFFNPYKDDEAALISHIDSIAALITKYKISALSGYYFQAVFLRKYFPNFPVLTWTDQPSVSLVANVFNKKLLHDENIPIVLYPADN